MSPKEYYMFINPVSQVSGQTGISTVNWQKKHSMPVFKTYNPSRARAIEAELSRNGISSFFRGNDFVADCVKKTTEVFEKLFGKSALPECILYDPLSPPAQANYSNLSNKVTINSNLDGDCYYDLESLIKQMKSETSIIMPSWSSSAHPAHIFVHEYSHSAHWHHLKDRNGYNDADRVWLSLRETRVPTAIGRLITRFKISNYAVEGKSMNEFMAERMSKDICNGLTINSWTPYTSIDVGYSDIFNRKWNYRYSSPQSYIDYFTQQVWNGDIEEAKNAGKMAAAYLAELDAQPVPVTVTKINTKLAEIEETAPSPISTIAEKISNKLNSFFTGFTKKMDDKNKLTLKY